MLDGDLPTICVRDYPAPQLHPALGLHGAAPNEHRAADDETTSTASDT